MFYKIHFHNNSSGSDYTWIPVPLNPLTTDDNWINSIISLSFLKRYTRENNNEKINSVCKFEFVESVKSKNIDQNNKDLILELLAIDLIKNKDRFEINLIFNNNSLITLSTEIVEATLEDQNKI